MGSPAQEVARIRLPAERTAADALVPEYVSARTQPAPGDPAAHRRALLSTALLLTETMAPRAYAVGRDVMTTLGVAGRLELYQSGDGGDNAQLVLHGDPIGVRFTGGCLASLEGASLAAVLGHEIGHALAHLGDPSFAWLFGPTVWRSRNREVYALASELTADRFGLLACGDLQAALRVEMHGVVGAAAPALQLDTAAYLDQCRTLGEDALARGTVVHGHTHPEHYIRGYAAWLFSETDLYASLGGKGPGTRPIAAVDAILGRLIGAGDPASVHPNRSFAPPRTAPPDVWVAAPRPEPVARAASQALAATRDVLASIAGRVRDDATSGVLMLVHGRGGPDRAIPRRKR